MTARVANESEHRRGLVLGLTLAEILILLLFLILLALGARLVKVEKSLKELEPLFTDIRKDEKFSSFDARKIVVELARVKDLDRAVSNLKDENSRLRRDLADKTKKLDAFEKVVAAASAIDPNDPPAVLKFVPDALEIVGLKVERTHWTYLSELVSKMNKAEQSMTVVKRDRYRQAVETFIVSTEGTAPPHSLPPIINLSEAKGYFFEKGKAELTPDFEQQLRTVIVPQLQQLAQQHGTTTIEVIGHTDEQKVAQRTSNLDWFLLDIVNHAGKVSSLIPADNAGLGLARAAAVMRVLTQDDRMKNYIVLPLSGGQLINADDRVTTGDGGDDKNRRRIEIRLRRSNLTENPTTNTSSSSSVR